MNELSLMSRLVHSYHIRPYIVHKSISKCRAVVRTGRPFCDRELTVRSAYCITISRHKSSISLQIFANIDRLNCHGRCSTWSGDDSGYKTAPLAASEGDVLCFSDHSVFLIISQPSIYIDGWLYAMRMTSVVCNVPVLSQNDSTYHHSVFTTYK